jgi:hypothetical protein
MTDLALQERLDVKRSSVTKFFGNRLQGVRRHGASQILPRGWVDVGESEAGFFERDV